MTDERTGHDTGTPAQTSQGSATDATTEEAVDESGASAGAGALNGPARQPGQHGVEHEQAEASRHAPTPAFDADADGELAARLVDTDGDGTADDAVVNAPEAP